MITEDGRYRAEVVPDSLRELADRLAEHFGVPRSNIGTKGSLRHRRGYHRSARFLAESPYSRDTQYSVTDAPGNQRGNPDWCCGLDISLPPHQLIPMCQRLDAAVRAGRLEKVAEWYGNDDGDNRVDGFNNLTNAVASSDSSHRWHAHLGIIREHAGDDHSDLFAILAGEEEDEVDQKTGEAILRELGALNDFLQTGQRYGKAATAPPDSTMIGTLHRLLQGIERQLVSTNELLATLVEKPLA